jgi:hypothetical protein
MYQRYLDLLRAGNGDDVVPQREKPGERDLSAGCSAVFRAEGFKPIGELEDVGEIGGVVA